MSFTPLFLIGLRAALCAFLLLAVGVARGERAGPGFQALFDAHGAVMLLIDPDSGRIVDANPAASAFYGYSRDDLRAMNIDQINTFTPEQVAEERQLAARAGRSYFVFRHHLADGSLRTVEAHAQPFDFGDRTLLFSIINDVTPGRLANQGLWHYQSLLEA